MAHFLNTALFRSAVAVSFYVVLCLAACQPEEAEQTKGCESLATRHPEATASALCAKCPIGAPLCASEPHPLVSGYRIGRADVAWTGKELAVVWDEIPERDSRRPGVRLGRASPLGQLLFETTLSRSMGEGSPHVIWTGNKLGVTWTPPTFFDPVPLPDTPDDPVVAVVAADGTLETPEHRRLKLGIAEGGKLAWNGNSFAIAWADRMALSLSYASANGERTTADKRLTQWGWSSAIVWNDRTFALAWDEMSPFVGGNEPRTHSLRLLEISEENADAEPHIIEGPLARTNPRTIEVHSLLWTGEDYALLWSEVNDDVDQSGLYLARIAPGTAEVSAMTLVKDSAGMSWESNVAWTGSHFVVAWPEYTGDYRLDLFVASYSPALELLGGPLQLSAGTGREYTSVSAMPALAAIADDLVLVVWTATDEALIPCPTRTELLAFAQVAVCE